MKVDEPALTDAAPAPRWPGFSITNLGVWFQLRCDNCGKATSPATLAETLIDELVREHRCGPPLSTHWYEAVSLGAGYAVAWTSFAQHIEQAPFGVDRWRSCSSSGRRRMPTAPDPVVRRGLVASGGRC